ncbi:MAG: hypothetical protein E7254_06535 [Lachnospiraceae bacterium]|nr:hypothetical protein [Lachnospiraceae bacterium]
MMDEMQADKKISIIASNARVFFLISIVSAHIGLSETAPIVIQQFWSHISSIGVVGYLIISSYYYNKNKWTNIYEMLKRKTTTVLVPWFIMGSVGYCYKAILSHSMSIIEYLKFIIGNGSYLYYMTVLFLCFIIFYYSNWRCNILYIALSLVSLLLTSGGYLDDIIDSLHITNYLNILNWIGYFAVGQFLQIMDTRKLFDIMTKYKNLCIMLFSCAFIIVFVNRTPVNYFSNLGWAYNILGVICIFSITSFIVEKNIIFEIISKDSFTVYLIHFMIIGVTDNIYNRFIITQAVAPLIVIIIGVFVVQIMRWINDKYIKLNWIPIVMGFR